MGLRESLREPSCGQIAVDYRSISFQGSLQPIRKKKNIGRERIQLILFFA